MNNSNLIIANRFKVIQTFEGGMGSVHICIDTHADNFPVALKTIKKDIYANLSRRERFLREATVWVELGFHPNLVEAYKVFDLPEDNSIYIAFQVIPTPQDLPDPSLNSIIYGRRLFTEKEALELSLGIIRGMIYATETVPGLVHRDLKPANILMDVGLQPKITDFGLVGIPIQHDIIQPQKGMDSFRKNFTNVSNAGTLPYMSPEQILGQAVDMRSDIYAFGCIIFEVLTRQRYISETTERAITNAVFDGTTIRRLAGLRIRPSLNQILTKCIAINPSDRFSNWRDLGQAVEQILSTEFNMVIPPTELPIDVGIWKEYQKASSYLAIGTSYNSIGNYEISIDYFKTAEHIAKIQSFSDIEALTAANQGVVAINQGDFLKATEFLTRAIDMFIDLDEEAQVCYHTGNLGNAYFGLYDLDKAQQYLERAYQMATKIGNPLTIARWIGNLGNVYLARGRVDLALKSFQAALELSRKTNDLVSIGKHQASIANAYDATGDNTKAEDYYYNALQTAQQAGDRQTEGLIYLSLGNNSFKRNKINDGMDYCKNGLEIARVINDQLLIAKSLSNLGTGYLTKKNPNKAIPYLDEALIISKSIQAMDVYARTSSSLGLAYELKFQFKLAVSHLSEAVRVFKQLNMPEYRPISEHLKTLKNALGIY